MELAVVREDGGLRLTSRTSGGRTEETVEILMDVEGGFVSGTREIATPAGKLQRRDHTWMRNNKVDIRTRSRKKGRVKHISVPAGKPLAIDASLLVLLGSLAPGKETSFDIFMVDFTGRSVTVTARHGGTEHITVPAGEFDCRRIEVTVNLPLVRPTITYWLREQEPHFLVKHRGKRGPLSTPYTTSLVSCSGISAAPGPAGLQSPPADSPQQKGETP